MEQEEKKQKSQAAENQASCSSLQPVAPHPFISVIPLAVLITLIVLVVKIFGSPVKVCGLGIDLH